MAAVPFSLLVLLLLPTTLLLSPPPTAEAALSESDALIKLKKSFVNASALGTWTLGTPPCGDKETAQWAGVVCFHGIITGLRLSNMGLSGEIDVEALTPFPGLRSLSFINNSFAGPIPAFNRLGALKSIYLTGNNFSGEIPDDFFSKMDSLKKVWLAHNAFSGTIPSSLSKPFHLMELHLENNQFSGILPNISQTTLRSFNVSFNPKLEGEVPSNLEKFDTSSFNGNPNLCGKKLGACPEPPTEAPLVPGTINGKLDSGKSKLIGGMLVLVLCVLTVVAVAARRRTGPDFDTLGSNHRRGIDDDMVEVCVPEHDQQQLKESGHAVPRRGPEPHATSGRKAAMGELMVVNDERGTFGLPDLMKAAAEVLGNTGGLGTAYKAVMGNGVAVVVKRMREMNRISQDGFEAEMRRLGRLRHPNILSPLAFLYRKEEKLLVYEFISGGSLLHLLHGNRGHVELDWKARLKIIRGIARGLAYLHSELPNSDLPHGNLKSSNILLGPDLTPFVSDFGYSPLVIPTHASNAMFAYKSPEFIQYHRVSPKSDVYCFGIVVFEVLTGKYPSQYNSGGKGGTDLVEWVATAVAEGRESELFDPEMASDTEASAAAMERLLHLGAACVEPNPEKWPDMREVARRIDEIAEAAAATEEEAVVAPIVREGGESTSGRWSHAENVRAVSAPRRESFHDGSGGSSDAFGFDIS